MSNIPQVAGIGHWLIGSAEAARRLGITRAHVSNLVAAGKLAPAHRAPGGGKPFLFIPEDVDALVEARKAARTARTRTDDPQAWEASA